MLLLHRTLGIVPKFHNISSAAVVKRMCGSSSNNNKKNNTPTMTSKLTTTTTTPTSVPTSQSPPPTPLSPAPTSMPPPMSMPAPTPIISTSASTSTPAAMPKKPPPLTAQVKAERQCYIELLEKLRERIESDESDGMVVPVYKKSLLYGDHVAIRDTTGEYTYMQLYTSAKRLATQVSNICGSGASVTVACLTGNDALTTLSQWACWMSGQVVMPLISEQPLDMLYALAQEATVRLLIATHQFEMVGKQLAERLDVALIVLDHTFMPPALLDVPQALPRLVLQSSGKLLYEGTLNNDFYSEAQALILHTAGATTNRPKAVRITHRQLHAQTRCLAEAWHFSCNDTLLHALPLRCLHGLFGAFLCPLSVGGKLLLHDDYNSHNVWSSLLGINTPAKERCNVFIGVPGVYGSLVNEYEKIFSKNKRMVEYITNYCRKNVRLMACSAARLPEPTFRRWTEITGHNLLECYSSTEMGVTIANPYVERENSISNDARRRPGSVGLPLSDIDVRLMSPDRKILLAYQGVRRGDLMAAPTWDTIGSVAETHIGELYVAGEQIASAYVLPALTEDAFIDGYFRTGDIAAFEDGSFKILGRSSADIIETNGHRVESRELETLLSGHPSIKDVAVLGVPDTVGGAGERISAICVLQPDARLDLSALHEFCANTALPTYKLPQALRIVDKLPRLGNTKFNKLELLRIFFDYKTKL